MDRPGRTALRRSAQGHGHRRAAAADGIRYAVRIAKGQSMIKAVIFDMDGTIFDTEVIYEYAWKKAGVTQEQYLQLIGRGHKVNDAALSSWGMDPVRIRRIRNEYMRREINAHGITPKPGAEETLQWLGERGIPAAIATSSPMELALEYMERTGFGRYFAGIYSGYQLERGKPAPDLFLHAARQLGREPEECVVVEDSCNGIRAGRNAGMLTVMVPDRVPADDEMREKADVILDSLLLFPAWLTEQMQNT